MAQAWRRLLAEDRKLQPSHRRHVFRYNDYIVKVPLEPDEPDYVGQFHDPLRTALADENVLKSIDLVKEWTRIPVPEVVSSGPGFTVFKRIEGEDLETVWNRLSTRQLDNIKIQLKECIRQLWKIPNPFPEFAVGSLCSTHALLRVEQSAGDAFHGPFKTTEDYRNCVKTLFDREPKFPTHAKPVFDHMDWYQCNIILTPNLDSIAGIIDWEYAGFIPDPKDMHLGDIPISEWNFPEWADIFDGLEQPTC
jgi:aminoglycoside phosphotransferase (APT) family kinase protein